MRTRDLASLAIVRSCLGVAAGFVLWAGCLTVPSLAQTPPPTLPNYVVLGVDTLAGTPAVGAKASLADQSFVAEGDVGVNDSTTTHPTSLTFGNSVFMADGSAVVSPQCSTSFAVTPPPSNTSIFNLWSNPPPVPPAGDCINFVRSCPVGQVCSNGTPFTFTGTPPVFAPPPLSFNPCVTTGCPNPTVAGGTVMSLSPGSYHDVVVQSKGELDLPCTGGDGSGTYEFESLQVQKYASVRVGAPCTVNIEVREVGALFEIQEFGSFGPALNSGVNPNQIHVTCGCGSGSSPACTTIVFNQATHVAMSLYAPNAQLRLRRSLRGKGQFVANNVNGEETLLLRAASAPITVASNFNTLTQSEYGAPGTGNANDPSGLVTLNPGVLPITIGAPGIRSLTVPDQTELECFLPVPETPSPTCPGDPSAAALCAAQANAIGSSNNNCASPNNPTFPQFMTITGNCSNVLDEAVDQSGSGGQGAGALAAETVAAKLNVALSNIGSQNGGTPGGLGDFILPVRLCTNTLNPQYQDCAHGRVINRTGQLQQGIAAGLEDGLTTVNDLIAQADEALGSDCNRSGTCTNTCGTAFAPPDPIRITEIEWALQAVNECFDSGSKTGTVAQVTTDPAGTICSTNSDCCSNNCSKSSGRCQ